MTDTLSNRQALAVVCAVVLVCGLTIALTAKDAPANGTATIVRDGATYIKVPPGEKVENSLWMDGSVQFSSRPMADADQPTSHNVYQACGGRIELKAVLRESRK